MEMILGTGASKGSAEAKTCSLDELKENQIGESAILVDECIPPIITTLSKKVIGIVVEEGGILSHAACIARELGIPCIIGVENALERLKNKRIKIIGEKGEVYVL